MSAHKITPGDQVVLRPARQRPEHLRMYGAKCLRPFVVEVVDRSTGRYAVAGGDVMFWRTDVRRTRTKRQLARDAAKKP